jgi:1-acyl-sn-glycerol-3-phosphate acyltransferase
MTILQSIVTSLAWTGTSLSCRIDAPDLGSIPQEGPLILAINHINSLEVPLLMSHLWPRRVIVLAKEETWDNKVMGYLFDLYHSIPIQRGSADLGAIHRSLDVLSRGAIMAVAPEGTRSYDGKLIEGQPGIVLIALRAGAPILPVVHWGGECYSQNLKHFRRTDFHIRIGKPFRLDPHGEKIHGGLRKKMADEIMYQLAALMPKNYRGCYAGDEPPPPHYLQFI